MGWRWSITALQRYGENLPMESSHRNSMNTDGHKNIKTKVMVVQFFKVVIKSLFWNKYWGSSVGISNLLRARKLKNFDSIPGTDKIYIFSLKLQTISGAKTASYSLENSFSFPRKRGWKENHYSPPSNTEVKNEWSYTYSPPIRLYKMHRHFTSMSHFISCLSLVSTVTTQLIRWPGAKGSIFSAGVSIAHFVPEPKLVLRLIQSSVPWVQWAITPWLKCAENDSGQLSPHSAER